MSDGDSLKVTESGQDCTWKVADLKWICSPAAEITKKLWGVFYSLKSLSVIQYSLILSTTVCDDTITYG